MPYHRKFWIQTKRGIQGLGIEQLRELLTNASARALNWPPRLQPARTPRGQQDSASRTGQRYVTRARTRSR